MESLPVDVYSELSSHLDNADLINLSTVSTMTRTKTDLLRQQRKKMLEQEIARQYSKPQIFTFDLDTNIPFISYNTVADELNTLPLPQEIKRGDIVLITKINGQLTIYNNYFYTGSKLVPAKTTILGDAQPEQFAFPEFPLEYYSNTGIERVETVWIDYLPIQEMINNIQIETSRYLVTFFRYKSIKYVVIVMDTSRRINGTVSFFENNLRYALINGKRTTNLLNRNYSEDNPLYMTFRKDYAKSYRYELKENGINLDDYDEHFTFIINFN